MVSLRARTIAGAISSQKGLRRSGLVDRAVGASIIARERTDCKKAEHALLESEERMRVFIEYAPAALAMFDREMRYMFVSHRWLTDYGLEGHDLRGRSHYEVFTEVPECWKQLHGRGLKGEVLTADCDRFERADGSAQWVKWEIRPWYDAKGEVGGIVIFTEDITDSKNSADEVRRLNAELEARVAIRTAELEAAIRELEAFTYSVSHDLRAPLRHIAGFSRILTEDFASHLPLEARDHLRRVEDGVRRMGVLVDELLNLARVGRHAVKPERTDLNAIVQEVVSLLQPEIAGRVVNWKIASLPPAVCDPILIKQVFQNFIANALKFTRPRSCADIEISCQSENRNLVIAVRDNGVGFNMKYADKLFGVFQRLHRAEDFEGTGIGLATVQRIVHKHGGRVWAQGELDKGAVFYFTLPLEDASPEVIPVEGARAIPGRTMNRTAIAGARL
jgi:PAS domain S-box-containing protein